MSYRTRCRWVKREAFNYEATLGLTDYSNSATSDTESNSSSESTIDSFLSSQTETINEHFDDVNITPLQLLDLYKNSEDVSVNILNAVVSEDEESNFSDYNNMYNKITFLKKR